MRKAEITVPVIPVLIFTLIALGGGYLAYDTVLSPDIKQKVKETESYQDLENDSNIERIYLEVYEVNQSTVKFSEKHDYPYSRQVQKKLEKDDTKSVFVPAADTGNLDETESSLVVVNASTGDRFHQMHTYQFNEENEIINQTPSREVTYDLMDKALRNLSGRSDP